MRACVAAIAVVGCAVEVDPDLGIDRAAKQSANSLSENSLAKFAAELDQLVDAPLAQSAPLAAVATSLFGRRLLHYVAHCALRRGDAVSFVDAASTPRRIPDGPILIGGVPTVAGLGLAPEWPLRRLTTDERRWVMGCTLAHINAQGWVVDISLRGNHPAYVTTAAERQAFPYLEGAFYGDFRPPSGEGATAQVMQYACWGPGLGACGDPAGELRGRICARGGCDHFVVVGPCERPPQAPPTTAVACDPRRGDGYGTCYGAAGLGPPAPGVEVYGTGVATTYLREVRCD